MFGNRHHHFERTENPFTSQSQHDILVPNSSILGLFLCADFVDVRPRSDVTANEKQNVGPVCSVHHPSHPHSGPGPDFSSMALVLVFVVVALPQRAATSDEADDGARSRVINYYSILLMHSG
jgi:hypothetical protein